MRNLTMLTDLYQLTMMQGYFNAKMHEKTACFDVFFRENGASSYGVSVGLEQVVDYIQNLHFEKEDIEYLNSLNLFTKEFLEYLKDFKFTGSIRAVKEGTIVFPNEPILIVEAKIFEAQFIETAILNILNFQTLIATKASRINEVAHGNIMEFGLRRAQAPDAGIYGTRASYIGGVDSTSNVYAGKKFGIKVSGTHSHSFVMSFKDELTAFREYAKTYPDDCLLLVDTYDTINSGLKNAITVFKELREKGHKPKGIRIDSGDLAYLSKVARRMLDENGFTDAKICVSGDLDEYVIQSLKSQGAKIDLWGVGTKLITSFDNASLGGVYKMSAIMENGEIIPKMKISNSIVKMTNPGIKTIYRIYDKDSKMALADLIALKGEIIDESKPLTIFSPNETWKKITLTNFFVKEILIDIFEEGKLVYDLPKIDDIKAFAKQEKATFWQEYKRVESPHIYKVDLSDKLYALKKELLNKEY